MKSSRKHLDLLVLVSLLILLLPSSCLAEGDDADAEEPTQEDIEDDFIVAISTAVCTLFLSFMGLVIGYYSFLEDSLMILYQKQGIPVEGDVRYCEELRQKVDSEMEYVATVHYKYRLTNEAETSSTRQQHHRNCSIHKQVKAWESDFQESPRPAQILQIDLAEVEGAFVLLDENSFASSPKVLQLVVLAAHPRSALPKQHIERACSLRYRLPTYVLVISIVLVTIFCVYVILQNLDTIHVSMMSTVLLVSLCLLSVEALFIWGCLGGWIHQCIQQEYLEGEDIVADLKSDDTLTTLSSIESFV